MRRTQCGRITRLGVSYDAKPRTGPASGVRIVSTKRGVAVASRCPCLAKSVRLRTTLLPSRTLGAIHAVRLNLFVYVFPDIDDAGKLWPPGIVILLLSPIDLETCCQLLEPSWRRSAIQQAGSTQWPSTRRAQAYHL